MLLSISKHLTSGNLLYVELQEAMRSDYCLLVRYEEANVGHMMSYLNTFLRKSDKQ